jgi:hypothetical protein
MRKVPEAPIELIAVKKVIETMSWPTQLTVATNQILVAVLEPYTTQKERKVTEPVTEKAIPIDRTC